MKKRFYSFLMAASVAMMFTVVGCKKDKDETTTTDFSAEFTTQSDDNAVVSAEDDALSDDVNLLVETEPQLSGRTTSLLCNATVVFDTTTTLPVLRRATVTYNGANCDSTRSRTGQIVVTIPKAQHWRDVGAQLTVKIQNLHITRFSDHKSITVNGTKKITNVNGGTLATTSTVTHKIASDDMSITFDNGTMRTWHIAKQRVFVNGVAGYTITTTGTYNDGTNSDVAIWGVNRNGKDFSTRIVTPIVVESMCHWRVTSGQIIHTKLTKDITVTFGLDSAGNATSCPTGSYYMKIQWVNLQGNTITVIHPY